MVMLTYTVCRACGSPLTCSNSTTRVSLCSDCEGMIIRDFLVSFKGKSFMLGLSSQDSDELKGLREEEARLGDEVEELMDKIRSSKYVRTMGASVRELSHRKEVAQARLDRVLTRIYTISRGCMGEKQNMYKEHAIIMADDPQPYYAFLQKRFGVVVKR